MAYTYSFNGSIKLINNQEWFIICNKYYLPVLIKYYISKRECEQ